MTPPGHASRLSVLGNETELGFTIPRDVHESPLTRSRRPLLPETSIIPRRRIRQTNSYTHPRKKHKATSGSISRSYSVATREKGSAISFSPGGSLKQDSKLEKVVARPRLGSLPATRSSTQARLEILLIKEAEQRSGDGIHPRIDRQLLGSDRTFGHYEALRRIMVEYILTVRSPPSLHHGRDDLRDQLSTSSDTRFAAAYLMTRFWFLCEVGDHVLEWTGFVDYGWQLAIACLALCVRMQRDSLPPLYPVTNKELILLAPQDMTVRDLEQAQRDILEAISYSLQGNTPQPFLEELRCSLSTLQQLAAPNTIGDLTKRFWARMFDAILQRDVLFAPISMLAASVLVAVSPAERAAALREEVCGRLKMTKHEFDRASAWFEGVEKSFS